MKYKVYFFSIIYITIFFSACNGKLEIKPDQRFLIPEEISDLQAILDNNRLINNSMPYGMEGATDNYYLTEQQFNSQNTLNQNIYLWDKDVYKGVLQVLDWQYAYRSIFHANVVLTQLNKIYKDNDAIAAHTIRGQASFIRAYYYHFLALQFCNQYDAASGETMAGLPLKISSDINELPKRSNLADTYALIIEDIKTAINSLPIVTGYKTRPDKAAANALLARVYLSMGDYKNALQYSEAALALQPALLDYNSLDLAAPFPIERFNEEVLFDAAILGNTIFAANRFYVDSILYNSYKEGDLRKTAFYSGTGNTVLFRGSYTGSQVLFCGISNSEVYLNKAECLARLGRSGEAVATLDTLLENRYSRGTDLNQQNPDSALHTILAERRKELAFRGIRWMDLKRLNKFPENQVIIKRTLNGQIYQLEPNSPRYTYPIPDSEVLLGGLEQNNL